MESAGVDVAMLDIIGAEETIREVYHLDRPVDDFEATLEALCSTSMQISPHIVIGLHYGRILGEANALDILSRHPTHALVLVVIMPFYAKPGTFVTPDTLDVGRIFLEARRRLPDRQVLLGCARPPGMHKRVTDAYAVMAGLDGIRNKIDPGSPMDKDLYDLPPEEEKKIPTVCSSLDQALEALDTDREFLKAGGVFDDDLIDAYIGLKMEEVTRFRMSTHPVEFDMYYSL